MPGSVLALEAERDGSGGAPGELALGQTTDPALLVRGDPGALRAAAGRLGDLAGSFIETAGGLGGISAGPWAGAAADAFREKFALQPGKWDEAGAAHGAAAEVLRGFAGVVQAAQGKAAQAVAAWQAGQADTAGAVSAYDAQVNAFNADVAAFNRAQVLNPLGRPGPVPVAPGPFTDPGAGLRAQARQILAGARAARDEAGAQAAAAVQKAAGMAPSGSSLWGDVGSVLSDVASGAAGTVKGLWDDSIFHRSPLDWRNAAGPDDSWSSLAQSLNPVNIAREFAANPAKAIGSMLPGLAVGGALGWAAGGLGGDGLAAAGTQATADEDAGAGLTDEAGSPEPANPPASAARRRSGPRQPTSMQTLTERVLQERRRMHPIELPSRRRTVPEDDPAAPVPRRAPARVPQLSLQDAAARARQEMNRLHPDRLPNSGRRRG